MRIVCFDAMHTKLSRERRVFIGVLGIALAGLLVDRLFLGSGLTGASEASAAEEYALDPSTEQFDIEPLAIEHEPTSLTATLADRLEEYAHSHAPDTGTLPDVFQPSAAWLPESPAAAGGYRPPNAADEFRATHQLTAVMLSRSTPGAVVNKRFLTVGMEIDGFKLVSLSERSAVFDDDGKQLELQLAKPSG